MAEESEMIFQIILVVVLGLGWLWLIHTCNYLDDKIKVLEKKLADRSYPVTDFDKYWYATSTIHQEEVHDV